MLSNISTALLRLYGLFEREKGQALAEYGLIIALIAVALIAMLGFLALAITGTFSSIITSMGGATS